MELSLVIPCYNEEENIDRLYDEVVKAFSNCTFDYEFVFVDDGSKDNTYKKLCELYKAHKESNIQVLSFSRNFGKESAMYAGLTKAKGEKVCIIDADLQQRPEIVLNMLEVMNSDDEIDCVTAYQEKRKENKLMSSIKSAFYKIINKISDVNFVNGASDFRLMKRSMVDAVINMTEYHRFSKGIFSWLGFNVRYIPYSAEKRTSGKTKWSLKKLIKYALEGIFAFSTTPLRISAYIGFFTSLISIIYLIVIIIQKLCFGIDVPGYATIVVLVLLIGGIQLFCQGIIGEYLSKTYLQVKNRPVYILRKHLDDNDENRI